MEAFAGEWKLSHSEDFEEYMKALGVGMVMRKLGNKATPVQTITITDGNKFNIKTVTMVKSSELDFVVGEEFEETTIDGRKVKTTINWEDNKLVQVQQGEPESTITREIKDGKYVMTLKCGDVTCIREYTNTK